MTRIFLYDTTLRDGAQTQGVDFTVEDKIAIAAALDTMGIDYIEGGWPGANPGDDAFFGAPPPLKKSRLTAFGMTRRTGRSAANDPGLNAVLAAQTPAVCLVGKTWDFHAETALGVSLPENLALIGDSVREAKGRDVEVIFDAEHFFDGYKNNPAFALDCLRAAHDGGADWLVLCDTNGGTLPQDVTAIVTAVCAALPGAKIGIHAHNDTENAVANSLAAIAAGARMVQGTLNGLGERCGNANLVSLIPTLMLKMGYDVGIAPDQLPRLTHLSRLLDDRLNRTSARNAPYVGESAFAHKGGLHASAVLKDPRLYEHIDPAAVGNQRAVLVSDQAGRANLLMRLQDLKIDLDAKDPVIDQLVQEVKQREYDGFSYDGAEASFELLVRRTLGQVPDYYRLNAFRVIDERRWNSQNQLITLSEATIKIEVDGDGLMTVAEGNGPVNALDTALRNGLLGRYPVLGDLRLMDYKVRILTPQDGTRALTRVMIETACHGDVWRTVGVSGNIIDASYNALHDSIVTCLFRYHRG